MSNPRIRVTQHHPSFFEGFDDWKGEIETLDELLGLEFIARWTGMPAFYRFSLQRDYCSRNYFGPGDPPASIHLLMAEIRKGREWWVIAMLEGEDLGALGALPDWVARRDPE